MKSLDDGSGPQPVRLHGYIIEASYLDAADEFDLRQTGKALWQMKWMLAAIVSFFAAASIVVALASERVYRAEILVAEAAPADNRWSAPLLGQLGGLATLAGLSSNSATTTEQAIAVLRSRRFTADFISAENLMPVLFADRWDAALGQWISDDESEPPDVQDGVELFHESVRRVETNNESGLITLQIDWHDPETAAQWANSMIKRVNDHLRNRDISEVESTLEYLNRELESATNNELRTRIFDLMEQQIESAMLASVRSEYAFRIIDPAIPPDLDKPVRPKRRLIALVGFAAGLLTALVVGMVRIAFDHV